MSIVLTNGVHYIATSKSGGIIKTQILEEAQTFYNVNNAMQKIWKAYGKCKGYYPYDTKRNISLHKKKRKKYTMQQRKIIYEKSNGCCELCGKKLFYDDMTLDHIIPLSMGGKEELNNLQATCFACNQFKRNILPDDFVDRIIEIFLYQTEKKCNKSMKIRIINKLLESL